MVSITSKFSLFLAGSKRKLSQRPHKEVIYPSQGLLRFRPFLSAEKSCQNPARQFRA